MFLESLLIKLFPTCIWNNELKHVCVCVCVCWLEVNCYWSCLLVWYEYRYQLDIFSISCIILIVEALSIIRLASDIEYQLAHNYSHYTHYPLMLFD